MSSDKVQLVSYRENQRASEPKILKTSHLSLGKLLRMYRERDRERLIRQTLAAMVGVSSRTVRNWENDISLPTSHHLKKLIEVFFEQNLLTANKELDEARELWRKRQENDELNTLSAFDEAWFNRLLEASPMAKQPGANQISALPTANTSSIQLGPDSPNLVVGGKPKAGTPGNLPILNGPTIGREKELARLQTLIQNPATQLITLAGPGGVGKTRLALQTGHLLAGKFEDGIFFICLAALEEPALVLEMIAQTLGVREVSGLTLLQSIQAYLAPKKILLIIDNFEQVKSAARNLLNLLQTSPGLKLLISSRITLQIYGEQVFEVLPLALPPLPVENVPGSNLEEENSLSKYGAPELLLQRARMVKPDLKVTPENVQTLVQISQKLDGLPLALELAAARLKFFTPQALLRRLEGANNSGPLLLLEKGERTGPVRQQSLLRTLDWSYNLLEADEQFVFCSLAVFNDGASLAACEAVCFNTQAEIGPIIEPSKILNLLTRLVEKSLLRYENEVDGEPRFLMLQTIREYALEHLKSGGIEEVLWPRWTDYFVKMAENAQVHNTISEQAIWVSRLEKEHNNLRAVLHRVLDNSQIETALRLVASLGWFWEQRGYLSEGLRWAEETLLRSEALLKTV